MHGNGKNRGGNESSHTAQPETERKESPFQSVRELMGKIETTISRLRTEVAPAYRELILALRELEKEPISKEYQDALNDKARLDSKPELIDCYSVEEFFNKLGLVIEQRTLSKKNKRAQYSDLEKIKHEREGVFRKKIVPLLENLAQALQLIKPLHSYAVPHSVWNNAESPPSTKSLTELLAQVNEQLASPKKFNLQDTIIKLAQTNLILDQYLLQNDPTDVRRGTIKPTNP